MSRSIGEILNAKRRELGLSQSELASRLSEEGIEVTNQAISKWENGKGLPDISLLDALARGFCY